MKRGGLHNRIMILNKPHSHNGRAQEAHADVTADKRAARRVGPRTSPSLKVAVFLCFFQEKLAKTATLKLKETFRHFALDSFPLLLLSN